jgi:hypothetical protein
VLVALVVVLLLVIAGIAAGLVIITRLETGEWQMPDPGQVVRIIKREPRAPSRIIFLERKAVVIKPGTDDSATNTSSVLENVLIKAAPHTHANGEEHDHHAADDEAAPTAKPVEEQATDPLPPEEPGATPAPAEHDHSTHDHGAPKPSAAPATTTTTKTPTKTTTKTPTTKTPTTKTPTTTKPPAVTETGVAVREGTGSAKLPGWSGTDKQWKQVMDCVQKLFEPFDVEVVDKRPTDGRDFVLVAVGGRPGDLGVTDQRVGGLAPFHGGVIAKPVVFAFATQLNNDVKTVCETIGMEVAHAYGLDHGYLCSDVMTYLKPCGAKTFVDQDTACGEMEPRNCEGGEPTQNSYRRLLQVLGPTKKVVEKPATPAKK